MAYGTVATFLSLPNLAILLSAQGFLRKHLRYNGQFLVGTLASIIGVLIGTLLNNEPGGALAYSVSSIIVFQIVQRLPQGRPSTLVL